MSTRRVASATSVDPHALKNSPPPPKVAVPKQSTGTFNPDRPSCLNSIMQEYSQPAVGAKSLHAPIENRAGNRNAELVGSLFVVVLLSVLCRRTDRAAGMARRL